MLKTVLQNISYSFLRRSKQIIQKIPTQLVIILSQAPLPVVNYVQRLKKFGELFNKKTIILYIYVLYISNLYKFRELERSSKKDNICQ